MIFFTADCHFGHQNILSFSKRPFESIEAMDEALAANWNSRVTDRDDVYILGDLFYRVKDGLDERLKRLKGRKHLIVGNHDAGWMKLVDVSKHFVEVETLMVLKADKRALTLCHYPLMSWPHMYQGGYCIYGHIHNNTNDGPWWPLIRDNDHLLNAGVDINHYQPVPFEELVENNRVFKELSAATDERVIVM